MAIVYCSWATGNDTTVGTAANPRKTITKHPRQELLAMRMGSLKSPDPTALTVAPTAWTLNGITVTGTGTLFTTELAIGDLISAPDGGWYEGVTLTSDTGATLYKISICNRRWALGVKNLA